LRKSNKTGGDFIKKLIKAGAAVVVLTAIFLGCSPQEQTVSQSGFAPPDVKVQTVSLNAESGKSVMVYITKTGSKYHKNHCRYLKNSKIRIELEKARQIYRPCLVCVPPE
jgi:hypothetical protein